MSNYRKETKYARVQQGQQRLMKDVDRLVINIARSSGIHHMGDAAFVAVCSALAKGKWEPEAVVTALQNAELDVDFQDVQQVLREAGILTPHRRDRDAQFTDQFIKDGGAAIERMVQQAPAAMLPLDKPEPWHKGNSAGNVMNIRLVAHSPAQQQNSDVLEAVNALQEARFKVSQPLLKYLDNRYAEIKAKAGRSNGKAVQMQLHTMKSQKELLEYYAELDSVGFQITMDFRGRMYYRGGLLTPQGHDFQKAAWQFAVPMRLGKAGELAIAVHMANVWGHDKKSLQERIEWAQSDGAAQMAAKVASGWYPKSADKPYQYIVAALEWNRLQQWKAEGHDSYDFLSTLVCHQDGSCNGIQHASAITGNRATAEATNCTAAKRTDVPRDIYGEAAATLIQNLKARGLDAEADIIAKYGRKAMKMPVMTSAYGAGADTCGFGLWIQLDTEDQNSLEPQREAIYAEIWKALEAHAGAVLNVNKTLQRAVQDDMESKGARALSWETADGFLVHMEARAKGKDARSYVGAGRYVVRTDEVDVGAQRNGISANFIHSIDAAHLREVVRQANCELVTVHDSIGSHAGSFWHISKLVRQTFASTHKYDQVASLNSRNGLSIRIPKQGNYDPAEAEQSPYFFL